MSKVLMTYALLMVASAGLVVGGVYVLAGPGYSMLAGAVFTLYAAELLRRGMIGGG